jgi:hypothetical protein
MLKRLTEFDFDFQQMTILIEREAAHVTETQRLKNRSVRTFYIYEILCKFDVFQSASFSYSDIPSLYVQSIQIHGKR